MPLGDKKKTKGSAVQIAAEELRKVDHEIRDLKAEHEEVLKAHYGKAWDQRVARGEHLRDRREELVEQVKTEARKMANVGETTVLFEQPDLFISVTGTRPVVGYDLALAEKTWPKAVYQAALVRVIDPKVIAVMIERDTLSGDTLEAIRKARREEPQTAKVTVKIP